MTDGRMATSRLALVGLALIGVGWAAACSDSMTEAPPNRTPVAVGTIPSQTLAVGQAGPDLNLSEYFNDPDGDPLAYRATSTDPSVANATVTGSSLMIEAVAGGKATVTVIATDPGGLIAAQSTGVTVQSENRMPTAVGSIPAQNLNAGTSVTVDVSAYFDDPDGDALDYEATSNNTGVAQVNVSGSGVTITAVAEGSAGVTVTATDPGELSAEQGIDVVVSAGEPGFRDDFDAETLSGWDVTQARAELAEGILRLTNDSAGVPGQVDRALGSKLVDWEARVVLGRAHEDTSVRLTLSTGYPLIPAIALEIGSGVEVGGQDTNFRLLFFDGNAKQWGYIFAGESDAVHDSTGAFTEVTFSIRNAVLRVAAGDTELYTENLTSGVPPGLLELNGVGLWVVPFGDVAERTALFDLIEVAGAVVSSMSADAGIRPAASATPPWPAAAPRTRSGRWPPRGSPD